MKIADNAAVDAFKMDVDRMDEFLKAAGYEIKRTHLVEAAARFSGARDWRTLRAELLTKQPKQEFAVPDLKGKTVRVYFSVHATGYGWESPDFCFTDIDQSSLTRILEMQHLCLQNTLTDMEDSQFYFEWIDPDETHRVQMDYLTVSGQEFWFGGYPKHCDYKVETNMFQVAELVADVVRAVEAGVSELFYLDSVPLEMDNLKEQLAHMSKEDMPVVS